MIVNRKVKITPEQQAEGEYEAKGIRQERETELNRTLAYMADTFSPHWRT